MDIIEFIVLDSSNGMELVIRAKDTQDIMTVLRSFCERQGRAYHGYKYGDLIIENFSLTLNEIGVTNGSTIIAY